MKSGKKAKVITVSVLWDGERKWRTPREAAQLSTTINTLTFAFFAETRERGGEGIPEREREGGREREGRETPHKEKEKGRGYQREREGRGG